MMLRHCASYESQILAQAQAAPLIVHVGTSSSSPLTTGSFYQHVRLYFEAHPLPTAARLGKIPEKVFIVRNPLVGAAVEAASEVWWHVAAAWLAISGRMYLAQKMLDAWRVRIEIGFALPPRSPACYKYRSWPATCFIRGPGN